MKSRETWEELNNKNVNIFNTIFKSSKFSNKTTSTAIIQMFILRLESVAEALAAVKDKYLHNWGSR